MNKKISLFIVFVIIEIIAIFTLNTNYKLKKEQILKNNTNLIVAQYNIILDSFGTLANTVFYGYINKNQIINAFNLRDKNKLYNLLEKDYRYLKSIDFKQIHFHLPNNKSFLRMHKPNKYGDDLTNIRYSVDYVNTNKRAIHGLEMGKAGPGFRYVYPIFNNKSNHIGSAETSFSIQAFTNKLEKVYDVHTHFLIDKDIYNKKVFKDSKDKYSISLESEDYVMLKRDNHDKFQKDRDFIAPIIKNIRKSIANQIDDKITFSYEFSFENRHNKHIHRIATFIPLSNIRNQHIGYYVMYHNNKELHTIKKAFIVQSIIATFMLLLIFIMIYKELSVKEILRKKVDEKTKEIQDQSATVEELNVALEEINADLEDKIRTEVQKNAENERKLAHQSKQAALGDMIGNIAHQWRQPLSAITTAASGLKINNEMGVLEPEDFNMFADGIIRNANYLSQTIDDFRDFISSEKKYENFDVKQSIEKCLAVVNSSINNHKLRVITSYEDNIKINNYSNELQQVIINIFNNAKDALKEKIAMEEDRIIFITTFSDEIYIYIEIKDTAGGIPESIIEKIFEPYFTTKHQSQGTGLGLYMVHQILVDSMNGIIDVENSNFEYDNKSYSGAKFTIKLKLN